MKIIAKHYDGVTADQTDIEFLNSQTNEQLIRVSLSLLLSNELRQHGIDLKKEVLRASVNEIESQVGPLSELEKRFVIDQFNLLLSKHTN